MFFQYPLWKAHLSMLCPLTSRLIGKIEKDRHWICLDEFMLSAIREMYLTIGNAWQLGCQLGDKLLLHVRLVLLFMIMQQRKIC